MTSVWGGVCNKTQKQTYLPWFHFSRQTLQAQPQRSQGIIATGAISFKMFVFRTRMFCKPPLNHPRLKKKEEKTGRETKIWIVNSQREKTNHNRCQLLKCTSVATWDSARKVISKIVSASMAENIKTVLPVDFWIGWWYCCCPLFLPLIKHRESLRSPSFFAQGDSRKSQGRLDGLGPVLPTCHNTAG